MKRNRMKRTMILKNYPCGTNAKTTGPAFSMPFFGVLNAIGVRLSASCAPFKKTDYKS
jgi:hypothetical protein